MRISDWSSDVCSSDLLATVFELFDVHIPTTFGVFGLAMDWGPLFIVGVFTALLILGTKMSARVNNVFTVIKVGIVLFVIVVGFTYFDAANLSPFVPPAVPAEGGGAEAWRSEEHTSALQSLMRI